MSINNRIINQKAKEIGLKVDIRKAPGRYFDVPGYPDNRKVFTCTTITLLRCYMEVSD